jgi:hypothetical protein
MTSPLACDRALAMRRRHLVRKRAEHVLTIAYHAAAVAGLVFIACLILVCCHDPGDQKFRASPARTGTPASRRASFSDLFLETPNAQESDHRK